METSLLLIVPILHFPATLTNESWRNVMKSLQILAQMTAARRAELRRIDLER